MAEAGANGAPPEPAGSEKCFVPFPHRHFNRYGETVVCPSLARVVWPDGVSRFYDPGPDAA